MSKRPIEPNVPKTTKLLPMVKAEPAVEQELMLMSERLHSAVLPKRRRVVRACDRCRKLKIKCSGDMPCIHCTVYSYECTYNQPTRTRRRGGSNSQGSKAEGGKNDVTAKGDAANGNNAAAAAAAAGGSGSISALASANPGLMAKMSDRLKLYDDVLHRLLPDVKLTDLNDNPQPINPMKLMAALNELRERGNVDELPSSKLIAETYEALPDIPVPHIPTVKMPGNRPSDQVAPPMTPAGSVISKVITAGAGTAAGPTAGNGAAKVSSTAMNVGSSNTLIGLNGPSTSTSDDLPIGKEMPLLLPSREVALDLISKTWGSACVLFRFYHRVAFIEDLNELYDTDPSQYTNKQQRFLPLVYSVLACGALFYKSEQRISKEAGPRREDVEDEGYKYFTAARKLIDITDTRDTYGIQTIVMLIIFLQCSARLSTCYAYIGIALRAAMREGLHRKLNYPFNPIELETRKRLFWTLYKMDIYVNTMLGLPRTISEDDFDQELPFELDDENITVTGYRYDRQGSRLSSSGIANAHTKLMLIMGHIVAKLYPVKKKPSPLKPGHDVLVEHEKELQDWLDSLPMELKPGVEPPAQYLRANRILHISYLHVKIIMYRPYIHYIAAGSQCNDRASFEKAQNCIAVARVVVKLSEDMISHDMLSGNYWFSVYTVFFSVACLVYYVHYAPRKRADGSPDPEYDAIKKDAERGRAVLERLKDSSMAARRTYNILHALFEKMNDVREPITFSSIPTSTTTTVAPAAAVMAAASGQQMPQLDGQLPGSLDTQTPFMNSGALSSKEHKFANDQIGNLVNGVNFIDGVSTGINLKDTNDIPTTSPESFMAMEPTSPIDSQYMPGPMDQLDMKIFGRFLPPYMLGQAEPSEFIQNPATQNQTSMPQHQQPLQPLQQLQKSMQQSQQPQPMQKQLITEQQQQPLQTLPQMPPTLEDALPPMSPEGSLFELSNPTIPAGLATVGESAQGQRMKEKDTFDMDFLFDELN